MYLDKYSSGDRPENCAGGIFQMKNRLFFLALMFCLIAALCALSGLAADAEPEALPPEYHTDATTISSVSVWLTSPKIGEAPDYNPELPSGSNVHYYSESFTSDVFKNDVRWTDMTDGKNMYVDSDKFKAGHAYQVTVYLTSKTGYSFSDSTTGMINGKTAECRYTADGQLAVEYTFPALPDPISGVSVKITAPVAGEKPDYAPVLPSGVKYYSADYSGLYMKNDVSWKDETTGNSLRIADGVFIAGHVYTVRVYLTAEDGYVFSQTSSATVNGEKAECEIADGQLEVRYTFPAAPEVITSVDILNSHE